MTGFQGNDCSTARQQLSTNPDGTDWEHFFLEGEYRFSNQIPNRESFTTADPGQLFYERGQCRWGVDNPSDMGNPNTASMAGEGIGGAGLLLIIGIAAAGVWAWNLKGEDSVEVGYHPMADVPAMPDVMFTREGAAAAAATSGEQSQPGAAQPPPTDSSADSQQTSQPNDGGVIDAPWDDVDPTADESIPTVNPDTVQQPVEHSPYQIDKLKGVSLKQFKEQLAAHGITAESGSFKSVELLNYEGTNSILHNRMWAFWKEFGSRRVNYAVYFVFGLQDGGGRSTAFKEKFERAKTWVTEWYKEHLPND